MNDKQEILKYFERSKLIAENIIEFMDKEKDPRVLYLGILIAQKTVKQGLIGVGRTELELKELDDFLDMTIDEVLDEKPELKNFRYFYKTFK